MHLDSKSEIAGQPAMKIRALLRDGRGEGTYTQADVAAFLQISNAAAQQVIATLCEQGYLEAETKPGEEVCWHTTISGNALANARARSPIKRETAESLLAQFLERVKVVNASADYVYCVSRVVLFGSYLNEEVQALNDIDVAIWVTSKYPGGSEEFIQKSEARRQAAKQAGKRFKDFMEQLGWPETEVWRLLQARSPSLALHNGDIHAQFLRDVPTRILYP